MVLPRWWINFLPYNILYLKIIPIFHLILDEATYIKGWDKAVKYLADAGLLEFIVLVLTGSDLITIREARMRFPGRHRPIGNGLRSYPRPAR